MKMKPTKEPLTVSLNSLMPGRGFCLKDTNTVYVRVGLGRGMAVVGEGNIGLIPYLNWNGDVNLLEPNTQVTPMSVTVESD
jgi:hypothetical protein